MRMGAGDDVPSAPARLHSVIDRRATFASDLLACFVFLDHEEKLVHNIDRPEQSSWIYSVRDFFDLVKKTAIKPADTRS